MFDSKPEREVDGVNDTPADVVEDTVPIAVEEVERDDHDVPESDAEFVSQPDRDGFSVRDAVPVADDVAVRDDVDVVDGEAFVRVKAAVTPPFTLTLRTRIVKVFAPLMEPRGA